MYVESEKMVQSSPRLRYIMLSILPNFNATLKNLAKYTKNNVVQFERKYIKI